MNLKDSVRVIGEKTAYAPFSPEKGIYQDGQAPMCRDADGILWSITGHSHMGHIGMFRGTCLGDLEEVYHAETNFCVGHAEYAFSGIRYPEGVRPRGSVWPFGLYICPVTRRFFCFFHNETAWNGQGTGYDSFSYCTVPVADSDFRHVGLMHSDDEGRHWIFDRWVLTGPKPCFTELFDPGAGLAKGQPRGAVALGDGDLSLFVNPNDEYIYLFYNNVTVDTGEKRWLACDVFAARTRKRSDGLMGDFVKYYDGGFSEPGNLGRETPIVHNLWHPYVVWSQKKACYVMAGTPVRPGTGVWGVDDRESAVFVSEDLVGWDGAGTAKQENGLPFGAHYVALYPTDRTSPVSVIPENDFLFLVNGNGEQVYAAPGRF